MVAIQIDSAEKFSAVAGFKPIFPHQDVCTHLFKCCRKTNIALRTVAAHALDANRTMPDRTGCQEIRSGRCVTFDKNVAGATVFLLRRYDELLPAGMFDLHAEMLHLRQC